MRGGHSGSYTRVLQQALATLGSKHANEVYVELTSFSDPRRSPLASDCLTVALAGT